ncbi:ABC transporter permease subunit [Lutispora sp.]|uniref:ABC transporter permease subunit n=1 Tax=Lutispora sp. TaxID=2828727 RepID=UPI002B20C17A|nr:ABC transporter permease subunit [Lutispora sp.]MEA4961347.1 M28 family peptidase [Lutispora sp.]
MRRINVSLFIGAAILLFFLSMCFYPEHFSDADPYGRERLQYSNENGKGTIIVPPIPPNEEYPFGTDHRGRDVKSLIVYGSRLTIFSALSIATIRLMIALPLSIAAAYKVRFANNFISFFNTMFSAFPLIIVIIVLSRISLFQEIFKSTSYTNMVLLSVLGWSKLAHMLRARIDEILHQDFIEGEIAIGKNKLEIALQNILPHLIPSMFVLFFLETALILLTLCQLGVFGLAFSGGYENSEGDLRVPLEFDWTSMLAFSKYFYRGENSYLVLFPSIAFALSIIGFNMTGEGLKIEFEKENSKVITFIRAIPSFLSPIRLVHEIRNFDKYRKCVIRKLAFYCFVLLIVFFPQFKSPYKFDDNNVMRIVSELTSEKYEGRLTGFSDKDSHVSGYIAGKLQEYGLEAFDGEYVHENVVEEVFNIKNAEFRLIDDDRPQELLFKFREDYMVTSSNSYDGILDIELFEMRRFEVREIELNAERYKGKALIIDARYMDPRMFTSLNDALSFYAKPGAIIYIDDWTSRDIKYKSDIINKTFNDVLTLSLSSEAGDRLMRMGKCKVRITVNIEKKQNVAARSVIGYIPGADKSKNNEFVVIGSNLDGVGYDQDIKYPAAGRAAGAAVSLEIARAISESGVEPDRSIVFAFWDGNMTHDRGSKYFFYKYIINKNKRILYIDLMNLGYKGTNKLLVDNSKIFPNNKQEQKFVKMLKENAKKNEVKLLFGGLYSPAAIDFTSRESQPMILDSYISDEIAMTQQDSIDEIDSVKLRQTGQMLLDTIIYSFTGGNKQ